MMINTYIISSENLIPRENLQKKIDERGNVKKVDKFRFTETLLYYWVFSMIACFSIFVIFLATFYALNLFIAVEAIDEPIVAVLNLITNGSPTKTVTTRQCNIFDLNTCTINQIDIRIKEDLERN